MNSELIAKLNVVIAELNLVVAKLATNADAASVDGLLQQARTDLAAATLVPVGQNPIRGDTN